jgi:hypothetical protein
LHQSGHLGQHVCLLVSGRLQWLPRCCPMARYPRQLDIPQLPLPAEGTMHGMSMPVSSWPSAELDLLKPSTMRCTNTYAEAASPCWRPGWHCTSWVQVGPAQQFGRASPQLHLLERYPAAGRRPSSQAGPLRALQPCSQLTRGLTSSTLSQGSELGPTPPSAAACFLPACLLACGA